MILWSLIYTVFKFPCIIIVEKDEEGNVIALEYLQKRVQLHKAKYIKECVAMKEMENTEENEKKIASIPELEAKIKHLESISEVPIIRTTLHRMLRQYLLCYSWTQLHFLYVCLLRKMMMVNDA